MHPTLSIVIPAYNVGNYIRQCLDPIIEFNEIECEIIVVDDGSSDETFEILKSYEDRRLKIIQHQFNKGLPAARNTGFRAACGDYVIPLDSDDVPVPSSWICLLDIVRNKPEAVLAYGYAQPFLDGKIFQPNFKIKFNKPSGDVLSKIVTENNFISVGTAIINRKAIERVGLWNEALTIGEDWELWCRLAAEGIFIYSPNLMIGYRHRKSSMTKSKKFMDETKLIMPLYLIFDKIKMERFSERQYNDLKKTAFSNFHYRLGMKNLLFKNYRNALIHLYKSFTLRPSKIFHLINYPWRALNRAFIQKIT